MKHRAYRGLGASALLAEAFLVIALLASVAAAATGVAYAPRIQGAPDERVRELLKDVADAFSMKEEPPASLELLRKRAEGDVTRMVEVLRSEGYYGAEVTAHLEEKEGETEVVFQVEPGPRYTVESVDLRYDGGAGPFRRRSHLAGCSSADPARDCAPEQEA